MKRKLRKIINTIILLLKIILYVGIISIFLLLLSIENKPVLILSRTMGTTIFTFVVVGVLMLAVYGKYDVGRRKSKPIIYSMSLATIITDIVAYLQLMIMNTITPDIGAFRLKSIESLMLAIVLQILFIICMVYFGNFVYFSIVEPENCCIVTCRNADISKLTYSIGRYKKQYKICRIVEYKREDLFQILKKMDTVFLYNVPMEKRNEIIQFCYEYRKNIYLDQGIVDVLENNAESYLIDDIPLLNANVGRLSYEQKIMKRIFDITLSIVAIVICLPFWMIIAIFIKAGDGGRVFFKQQRATENGKIFHVYKFRTMRENVGNVSATVDDDRITKVGRVLRKTRLDETPQFINILKGDMSFVGPRPEMLENVYTYEEELPEFRYRLRVKAGLTGYAQIAGKYNTSPKDKLIMDMMYIENYSIWSDIKLLFQTLIVLLKSDSTEGFQKVDNSYVVEITPEDQRMEE